jgi:exonuclease VII small subunit
MTFWTPSGCSHAKLEAAMSAVGLQQYIPNVRTDSSALRMALESYAEGSHPVGLSWEVTPLDRPGVNGFELNWLQKGKTRNSRQHVVSAAIISGFVQSTEGNAPLSLLHKSWMGFKQMVTPDSVGRSLVEIATKQLHGVCLRPNGGLYWIPSHQVSKWNEYARAVEEGSGSVVTTGAMEANERTIASVKNALLADVTAGCEKIMGELSENMEHAPEWFERRQQEMTSLLSKVESVELALETSLGDCRRVVELVQNAYTSASLAAF